MAARAVKCDISVKELYVEPFFRLILINVDSCVVRFRAASARLFRSFVESFNSAFTLCVYTFSPRCQTSLVDTVDLRMRRIRSMFFG